MSSHCIVVVLATAASLSGLGRAEYLLTGFSPKVHLGNTPEALAEMERTLGISALAIEESPEPWLREEPLYITFMGPGSAAWNSLEGPGYANEDWGAPRTGGLAVSAVSGFSLTIEVVCGTSTLGMAFSALESNGVSPATSISINGGEAISLDVATLPDFSFAPNARTGYLVITAGPEDPPIVVVTLHQSGANDDGYVIDYIAYDPTPGQADLNGDCIVDGADLGILLGAWGGPGGDLNGDETTDGADLGLLLGAWTG